MESIGLYYLLINSVSDGCKLMAFVCIVFWFIRKGTIKTAIHKWIIAANNLFLIVGVPLGIKYMIGVFGAFYSGDEYENYAFINRATGPYWWAYWLMIFNMVALPNLLWFKKIRHSSWVLPLSILPLLFEWYVRIITSLHRDCLPSSWTIFHPFHISIINLIIYVALLATTYYIIQWHQKRKPQTII